MAKNKNPFRAGRTLDALYENVEILTGQRGGEYKAVTAKEVSALKGTVSTIIRGGSGGDSGGEEVIERPHAPINVQGFGGFSSVLLSWDNPTFQGFAHAEVWRATTNNLAQAVLIGTTPATVYSDIVNLGTGWYYWVRFINKSNVAGPHHDASGLYVETNQDIGDVIDELADQLENSQLFQQLQADIVSVRADFEQADQQIQEGLSSAKTELALADQQIQEGLDTAKSELEIADQALQGALDAARADLELADGNISANLIEVEQQLTDADSALAQRVDSVEADFKSGDSQLSGSLSELERVSARMNEILAMSIRQLNASYKTVSDSETAETNAKITQTQQVIADAEQALAQQITQIEAAYKAADAAINSTITTLEQTVANEDQALSQRITDMGAEYKAADATITGSISILEKTVADNDQAMSQRVDTIESDYQAADVATNASITTLSQTVASNDSAMSLRVDGIESAYKAADTATNSSITSLSQTVADNDSAMSTRVDSVESAYKAADSSLSSSISSLSTTVTNNKNSITTRVNSVEAAYKSADNTLLGQIDSLETAMVSADQALSNRIDTTTATINGVSATVSSHTQAIASINSDGSTAYQALWAQKASAGDVTAGIGILAGTGGVSQVVVSASQFFVYNPNSPGALTPTFAIDNGKVIIPKAMIETATIQILNAQTITADYVKSGISITSPVINGGTLTGAVLKIGPGGPYAGHNFYVTSGGTAYLNNATVKGTVVATGGSFSNVVIDENCTIRGTLDGAEGTFTGTVYAEKVRGDVYSAIVKPVTASSRTSNYGYITAASATVKTDTAQRIIQCSGISAELFSRGSKSVAINVRLKVVQNGVTYYSDAVSLNYSAPSHEWSDNVDVNDGSIFVTTGPLFVTLPAHSNLTDNVSVTLEHSGTLGSYCRVSVESTKTTFASHRTGGLWG